MATELDSTCNEADTERTATTDSISDNSDGCGGSRVCCSTELVGCVRGVPCRNGGLGRTPDYRTDALEVEPSEIDLFLVGMRVLVGDEDSEWQVTAIEPNGSTFLVHVREVR